MGNRERYRQAWSKHRKNVMEARQERDGKLAEIEKFSGSEYGAEQEKAIEVEFGAKLRASREVFARESQGILANMRDKARHAREDTKPPTDEQLNVVQAVALLDTLERSDYNRYAKLCEGTMAADVLYGLGKTRVAGGVPKPTSAGDRAATIINELAESVMALGKWDGTSRSDAVGAMREQHRVDGNREIHADPHAALAGSFDPTAKDFERHVIGLAYDEQVLGIID